VSSFSLSGKVVMMVGRVHTPFQVAGFVPLVELARIFAVDAAVIRRRLHAEGRFLYAHPGDRRLRMIKEVDVAAIFQIIPAPQRRRDDGVSEG
jgi:hypothetical protein